MNKLTNLLELNEKDNMTTAFGKGMIKGVATSALVWLSVGGVILAIGMLQKGKEVSEEVGE